MLTTIGLFWAVAGVLGYIFNLKRIISFAKELFLVGETTAKVVYYIAVFLFHAVAGGIVLAESIYTHAVALYKKFKGA